MQWQSRPPTGKSPVTTSPTLTSAQRADPWSCDQRHMKTQASSPRAGKADRKELSPCTEMAVLQLPLMVETLGEAPGAPSLCHLGPSELPKLWSQHRADA